MRTRASLVFGLLTCLACAQKGTRLTDYLVSHPWNDNQDGPLLVLEPERLSAKSEPHSLAEFDRKKVQLGSVTALVPKTMIVIDDSLKEDPNFYEGLPNDAKVLYLLRSLNGEQWRKVGSQGLALGDLQGEQKLVMESLLPKQFGWKAIRVGPDGGWGGEESSGVLTDRERSHVRLKVEKVVDFTVYLKKDNAMSNFSTDRARANPGDLNYHRDEHGEFVQKAAFGLDIRTEEENKLKPSQLDYSASTLSSPIAVPQKATVGSILQHINSSCGLEIIPDFRIADRTVGFWGGKATAKDLLKALALSVEGTYRKVGSAYVLTSDIAGMGSRKYRLAYWEHLLQRETNRRMDQWRLEMGAMSGFSNVKFDSSSPVCPNDVLLEHIKKSDLGERPAEISTDLLTPGLRRFLDQWDQEYRLQPIRKDKVNVSSRVVFRYVLPNGIALTPEREIGSGSQFRPRPTYVPGSAQSNIPKVPVAVPPGMQLAFLGAAEDPEAAAKLVKNIGKHHGSFLWLDTHNADALRAAVEAGKASKVDVGLGLRPWRWSSSNPDRTLAAEYGKAVIQRLRGIEEPRFNSPAPVDKVAVWVSPTDPMVPALWRQYQTLASVQGIHGVALLETQPLGYEPKREEWMSLFGPLNWASVCHGYTEDQRLRFLRQEAVDPIDIGDSGYWTTPDLRQTYFFDDGLRGMPSLFDGTDDTHPKTRKVGQLWREFLSAQNQKAIQGLLQAMGDKVTYMEPRIEAINVIGRNSFGGDRLIPWTVGSPLPVQPAQMRGPGSAEEAGFFRLPLPEDPMVPEAWMTLNGITALMNRGDVSPRFSLLLDLENIPNQKLGMVLDRWFK